MPAAIPSSRQGSRKVGSAGLAGLDLRNVDPAWTEETGHELKAPGAYEWWYFSSLSPAGNGVLITLFEGLPFHPSYLTQLNRHRNRLLPSIFDKTKPTMHAGHYPAAYFALYQNHKKVAQFLNVYPPHTSINDPASPDVRIGPNRITLRRDGSYGITVRGYGFDILRGQPHPRPDLTVRAELTYTPTLPGLARNRPFRPTDRDGASHQWILTAPQGQLTGTVRHFQKEEGLLLEAPVSSPAYHDHVYGHGPLGVGVHKLLWGYLQGENFTAVWHHAARAKSTPADAAEGLVLFQKDKAPIEIESPQIELKKYHSSAWLIRHPETVALHGSDPHGHPVEMLVKHTQRLDATPFHSRLVAEGTFTLPGVGKFSGTGATQVLQLPRLKWPIFSDITLRAIMPVATDDPLWRE